MGLFMRAWAPTFCQLSFFLGFCRESSRMTLTTGKGEKKETGLRSLSCTSIWVFQFCIFFLDLSLVVVMVIFLEHF